MKQNILQIFLSPLFLIGLFLLLINDFYLKAEFHNFLTGKLSDFAGLFIFPLFWSAFFPKRKIEIYVSTAVFFVFWKSPFSQFLIDFWNSIEFLRINRVIDFTDLTALLSLPVSYLYLTSKLSFTEYFLNFYFKKVVTSMIILISVFAFTATSFEQDRSIWLENKYELTITIADFESIVKSEKSFKVHSFQKATDTFPANKYPDLEIDPNDYSLHFDLQKPYCESKNIRMSIFLNAEENKITITRQALHYWCETPPTEIDRKNLIEIFEREVIEKLRQNNTQ